MNKYLFLEAIEKAGYHSQAEFANDVGVSRKILNNHINGITKISMEDATRYCEKLKLTEEKIIQIFLPKVSLNEDNKERSLNERIN